MYPQSIPQATTIGPDHGPDPEEDRCGSVDIEQSVEDVKLQMAALIVATGFGFFHPRDWVQFGREEDCHMADGLTCDPVVSALGPTGTDEAPRPHPVRSCAGETRDGSKR